MLSRRDCLAAGGTALAGALSGCLGAVELGPVELGSSPPEVRKTPAPDRRVSRAITDASANATAGGLAVGDEGGDSTRVWIWNNTGRQRDATVEIAGGEDADPWFRESYEFAPDSRFGIDLLEARRYAITVRVDDREETVTVPEDRFDCNDSATDVVVQETEIVSATSTMFRDCGGFWKPF